MMGVHMYLRYAFIAPVHCLCQKGTLVLSLDYIEMANADQ